MHLIILFTRLPTELQCKILQNLEANDRLNFIQSSPFVELTVARDLDWFIGLLVPLSARNVALATINAPKRGGREHIRQFRTRVKAFLAQYQAGLFARKLPNPFVNSSTGQGRKHLHPKQLGRFRDLLGLVKGIDLLLRDFVGKERATKLLEDLPYGLRLHIDGSKDTIFAPSVLDTGSSSQARTDLLTPGVGFAMTEDAYFFHDEQFQTNIHESFYRLELFRRVFYSNPMNPLFSTGDVTPFQTASPEMCLSTHDAHIHGFITRWNPSRRASLWDSELDRLYKSVTKIRLASRASGPGGSREVTKEEADMASHISMMRAENRRTYTAFEVLWTQYALWINNELRDFKKEVLTQARDLAGTGKASLSNSEMSSNAGLHTLRQPRLWESRFPVLTSALKYMHERAQPTLPATKCFRVGPDYDFSQHNMGLVLPEKGPRSAELHDEDTVWPVMFRFVTFLASLGLPFLNRCAAMDAKQRRSMLGSIFLYLGRIPAHRIPHFVVGEIGGDPFFGDLQEIPYFHAPTESSLHPTQTRQRVPADVLVRLSGHLATVLSLPKWDGLDKCVVTKEAWEAILAKFATDTVERSELPFEVSDSQWDTMQKAQDSEGLRTGVGAGCSMDEYTKSRDWLATKMFDRHYQFSGNRMTTRDSRAKVQFTGVQKRMREVGGLGIYH